MATPYAVLDLPGFLNGFGEQFARFSPRNRTAGLQVWLTYLKHLAAPSALFLPLAAAGAVAVAVRRETLRRWTPMLLFVAAYYYALASHPLVFGRYALPLVPLLCLLAAVPIVRSAGWVARWRWAPPILGRALAAAILLVLLATLGAGSLRWLRDLDRTDSRVLAARWLQASAPPGAGVAVDSYGPHYLGSLGFAVVSTEVLADVTVESLVRQGVQYVVLSTDNPDGNRPFLKAGRVVMAIASTPDRAGPAIRIVRLHPTT